MGILDAMKAVYYRGLMQHPMHQLRLPPKQIFLSGPRVQAGPSKAMREAIRILLIPHKSIILDN